MPSSPCRTRPAQRPTTKKAASSRKQHNIYITHASPLMNTALAKQCRSNCPGRLTCLLCISNSQDQQVPLPLVHFALVPRLLLLPIGCILVSGMGRPRFGMLARQLCHIGQPCTFQPHAARDQVPDRCVSAATSCLRTSLSWVLLHSAMLALHNPYVTRPDNKTVYTPQALTANMHHRVTCCLQLAAATPASTRCAFMS